MHTRLTSLTFSQGFLDGVRLDFAPGLNCLIGPFGSGKTTAIEGLRYALGLEPAPKDAQALFRSLIKNNVKGSVSADIETADGLSYTIARLAEGQVTVVASDGKPVDLTPAVSPSLHVTIMSQNGIKELAEQPSQQMHLIDRLADQEAMVDLLSSIDDVTTRLQQNCKATIPILEQIKTCNETLSHEPEIKAKLAELGEITGKDAEKYQKAHAEKAGREREVQALERTKERTETIGKTIQRFITSDLDTILDALPEDPEQLPNWSIMHEWQQTLRQEVDSARTSLQKARSALRTIYRASHDLAGQLAPQHKEQEVAFQKLISSQKAAEAQAGVRAKLLSALNGIQEAGKTHKQLTGKLTELKDERRTLLEELVACRGYLFDIRKSLADTITNQLNGQIRITVTHEGDQTALKAFLEKTLSKCGIKHKMVSDKLCQSFSTLSLAEAIEDADIDTLVHIGGINADQAKIVVQALSDPKTIDALERLCCPDLPTIALKDGSSYKPTTDISTGQKCTALLPILLLDRTTPLVIDQPEDNLDNRFVYQVIVDQVRQIKQARQLIFVTHNPNIPVLGDADRVFVFQSDGDAAHLQKSGTVDDCKDSIISILEGGEEAFTERHRRYGIG